MGWGDELMAAGQAARVHRETGRKVAILDRAGRARWHELWAGLDFISPVQGEEIATVQNGVGCRPYIRYPFTSDGHAYTGWRARDHRPVISEHLVGQRYAGGYVLIEPTIKAQANQNKQWGRWQEVVDALPEVGWVQCLPPGQAGAALRGVRVVQTSAFTDAVRVLNGARAYVGPEGGMHHASAALNVPAVVVFGGSPSIEATGYPDHINYGTDTPCGHWSPCKHCADVMRSIGPEHVAESVKDLLQ